MFELARGQLDRASPGSNLKRTHIDATKRLPLKVLRATSRYSCGPPLLHSYRWSAGTPPFVVTTPTSVLPLQQSFVG